MTFSLRTPVLFLVFNRPDTTTEVFREIRKAKPPRLYVAADGPRHHKTDDAEKVRQVRQTIQQGVDWNCEVVTLFQEENLGCRHAVSSALDWFFNLEEEGIILEDDCLPDPTFFRYCQELLERYRTDSRMTMISGNNYQSEPRRTNYSYYFSRYTHIWGWATWRRAWRLYDESMKTWPELREGKWLNDVFRGDEYAAAYWEKKFQAVSAGEIDTWDYQWMFSSWAQNGLSITPNCNLVSNIGFGPEATHTKSHSHLRAGLRTEPMSFPMKHPPYVIRDTNADSFTERRIFKHTSLQRYYGRAFARMSFLKQLLLRS